MCFIRELIETVLLVRERKKLKLKKQLNMPPTFSYGTSGYRAKADLLPMVVTRTAYYAALRARKLRKSIGLMITASHNPPEDNGVKLIDHQGNMLPMECESELDELVNVDDFEKFVQLSCGLLDETKIVLEGRDANALLIGTDTRESSPSLLLCAIKGCELAKCSYKVYERHTTPQLHFIVRATNDRSFADPSQYVTRFRDSLESFLKMVPLPSRERRRYTPIVYVDCANGVGGLWVEKYLPLRSAPNSAVVLSSSELAKKMQQQSLSWPGDYKEPGWLGGEEDGETINIRVMNDAVDMPEMLNSQCGADFVKIDQKVPMGFDKLPAGSRCASLDGDADRLVYFYMEQNPNEDQQKWTLRLLDGDHLAALFARFVMDQFRELSDIMKQSGKEMPLVVGVVQTAYSNGNSTRYFEEKLGVEPLVVKTGVKHCEPAARTFDAGIYFEANGHGTICFSEKFHEFINAFGRGDDGEEEIPRCVQLLRHMSGIINEVVGDGIADLLAAECILRYYNWSIQDWERETYKDLPSCSLKVNVKDRSCYKTRDDIETVLIEPADLQEKINSIVKKYKRARAFVRPSGTESIVRVYAEALLQEDANMLAQELAQLIH